jgi:hypothetical protein
MVAAPEWQCFFDGSHLSESAAEFDCVMHPVFERSWQDIAHYNNKA